jgi:O-acetyl-ADP-ribose deacetylase (regulator of RNase III)
VLVSFFGRTFIKRCLLRSLMNVRPPISLSNEYLASQDELLSAERDEKGIVDGMVLPTTTAHPRIVLWQGDITRLKADAVADADNSSLLGCFYPSHSCIDNAIHSAAGSQLRDECNRIMISQGYAEPTGHAKITGAYNLPCKYVLHTIGPIIQGSFTKTDCDRLASCYRSCLELASERRLRSVAFCCISTGEYHFPIEIAAEIAVSMVKEFLAINNTIKWVIFDVFKARDLALY